MLAHCLGVCSLLAAGQVLKGDVQPAIETHRMHYQLTERYAFIPEAFTSDFKARVDVNARITCRVENVGSLRECVRGVEVYREAVLSQ